MPSFARRVRAFVAASAALIACTPLGAQITLTAEPQAPAPQVRVLVELADAPAAVVYGNELRRPSAGGEAANRPAAVRAARDQVSRIRSAQDRFDQARRQAGIAAREIFRVQKAHNGIALDVDPGDIARLRRIAGVRHVAELPLEYPSNSSSVPFMGTPQLWNDSLGLGLAADGTGVRIGIIDTGIDYLHANFGGSGALADYEANDRTTIGDGFFPNARVVGGYDFAGDAYTGGNAPAPDPDPMDCNGHGTHVAGTAAGSGVNADGTTYAGVLGPATQFANLRIGPGTAPRAELYALRVFGCGGSTNLTLQAIDWAMDPDGDGDLSDHLDVINLSLGSTFGAAITPSSVAVDNAALAGVIVVASAGNSGDTFFIAGSPGVAARAIATAASADDGLGGPGVRVNAPAAIAGEYVAGPAGFGTPPPPAGTTGNVVIALDPADGSGPLTTDACSPLTNAAAMAGNIALIDRGTCDFTIKIKHAQDAGAIGAILANSAAGAFGNLGGSDPTITIPSVMVTFADGNTMKAQIASLNVTLLNGADTLASFSSRGPRRILGSSPRVKPDIAAPGLSIVSAQTGTTCTGLAPPSGCQVASASGYLPGSQALTLQGTSMASPHVAGIVALFRQIHPDWSVEDIKALAMNYALHDLTTFPGGGTRYGGSRIGAGRVDPPLSAVADLVAYNAEDPGTVSLTFDADFTGDLTRVKTLRVVNRNSVAASFDLGIDTVVDAPGIGYSLPGGSTITIPANATVEIEVQMQAIHADMKHTREASIAPTQAAPAPLAALGNVARHWLTEESAYLTFRQGGVTRLRVLLHTSARPASRMQAPPTIATGGAATGSTTIPLSGTPVCTGTLGAGPTCTGSFPTDQVSLLTPFELQISSPVNPQNAIGPADLQYGGVAFDATNGLVLFGATMWERWSTPTEVALNVCVDSNEDGLYDRIVFNSNAGTMAGALFGASPAPSAQDAFITAIFNIATSGVSVGGAGLHVNRAAASVADTALLTNNALFLGATPAQLGLLTGDNTFRYKMVTCPGNNPLCARSVGGDRCSPASGTYYDEAAGPFFWDSAAQGLNFGGNNLLFDLNGATVPVTWNSANVATNGALGALLIHHHNLEGETGEVVLLEGSTQADIAVTQSFAPAVPALGDNVSFTIVATNHGPDAAADVLVRVVSAAGLGHVSDDAGGDYDPGLGLWSVGALAPGASATLTLVQRLESTDQQCSLAYRGGSTPLDTQPGNDRAEVCLLAPRSSDVALAMSVSAPTVQAGEPVTYTLTVTNQGTDPAYGVDVSEGFAALPALDPVSSVASQGSYVPATGVWNLAALPVGGSATLALTFTAPNMSGALTNEATAASANADPDTSNNSASATTTVLSPADVSASKTVSVATAAAGELVTYVVTLANAAAFDQQDNPGDEFIDVLPAQLGLVSATASAGTAVADAGTNTVRWNGVVPANGSVTLTIVAAVGDLAPQPVSNQGTVNYDADGDGINEATRPSDDPGPGGSADPTVFALVSPATLSATKTVAGSFSEGGAVSYTIVITNAGPGTQFDNPGDEFTDVLPAALSLVSASASSGTAVSNVGTNTMTWNGSLASGASTTITVNAVIDAGTTGQSPANQGMLAFDADGDGSNEASAPTDDPGIAGGADPTVFSIVSPALVGATKTVSGSFVQGGAVVYTVTLANAAATAQLDNPGDEFVDVLPAGLTLVSASASSGTVVATTASNTVSWNGAIPGGASVTLTIDATIAAGTAGSVISNQGTVNFDADGDLVNESSVPTDDPGLPGSADPTTFTVAGPVEIGTRSKTVSGNFVISGLVTYTIVIGNSGQTDQPDNPGAEFVDVLPATLALVSASASSGTTSLDIPNRTVEWNGAIPAGGSVTITVEARIASTAAGQLIANQGQVFYDADGDGGNEASVVTDNPSTAGADDATVFRVAQAITTVPSLGPAGVLILLLSLGLFGAFVLVRRTG